MFNQKKLAKLIIVGGVLALLLPSQVFAAASLSLGPVKDKDGNVIILDTIQKVDLLEGYWVQVTDPFAHNGDIMKIAPNVNEFNKTTFGLNDTPTNNIMPYYAYKKPDGYYFARFADQAAPGSPVYIRLWSDANKNYFVYTDFSNGWNSDTQPTFSVAPGDWWKKDVPYTPVISKFEQVTTTPANGGPATSSLKVTSGAGTGNDGQRKVTAYAWKMGTTQDNIAPVAGAKSSILEIQSKDLVIGQKYWFQVTYSNDWVAGGADSSKVSYTVIGGAGGGPSAIPYAFIKGINTFTFSFDYAQALDVTGAVGKLAGINMTTVRELINNISKATGKPVNVFGWYDSATQSYKGLKKIAYQQDGVTIMENDQQTVPLGGTLNDILITKIDPTQPYQLTVAENFDLTVSGVVKTIK